MGLNARINSAREIRAGVLHDIEGVKARRDSQTACNVLSDDLVERRALELVKYALTNRIDELQEEMRNLMSRLTDDAKLIVCENMQERISETVNDVLRSRSQKV
jgi:siroheme synthase